jgi:hypothetical protein
MTRPGVIAALLPIRSEMAGPCNEPVILAGVDDE